MLPPPEEGLHYLVGGPATLAGVRPWPPYADQVCEFLNALSASLMADVEAKQLPDVISFAYWCRRANIAKLKQAFDDGTLRMGLGIAFHITPSNVPVNFAFSFAFAILSGNASVVRVPTREFPQVGIICNAIRRLLLDAKYADIAAMTVFVRYDRNDALTTAFSAICQARIIWGGNQAIQDIRRMAIPERSIEVAFADRYSFGVLDAASVLAASDKDIDRLAQGLYNDTYLMDQNACSSPHLLVWLGEDVKAAQARLWERAAALAADKYALEAVNAIDKFTFLCQNAIEFDNIRQFEGHGNAVYRVELSTLPATIDHFRGKFGYFYEFATTDLHALAHIVNTSYQTMTYFGVDKALLRDFVVANRLTGIDRIVPFGAALDIGLTWDGYDMVRTLSRIVDIH